MESAVYSSLREIWESRWSQGTCVSPLACPSQVFPFRVAHRVKVEWGAVCNISARSLELMSAY
jgi:hypothetical protein